MLEKIAGLLLAGCLIQAQEPARPTPQPPATPEDLAAGERIFRTQCASCHGPRGDGGRGANLARPKLLHAPDDQALFQVIARGIPDSEMPGHWFTAHEIWQLVAFVRTLGRLPLEKTSGDPVRGEKLYAGKGNCARCHTMAGRGGALGPDLSDIGAQRSAAYLRASLLDPEASVPDGFLQVRLVTRDGRSIAGLRLNEDVFSIQIRDFSDSFQSYWKNDLAELEKQRGKSPMPSYREAFSSAELDDVVAYLVSLGRER
jgi:putative heme-binding domain-containing protein